MQITSEQATFLQGIFLSSLNNEHRLTAQVIAAIPLDKGGYRPEPVSKSALELAWHMASSEMRFMDAVLNGAFNLDPFPMPDYIVHSSELVAWYKENFALRFEALKAATPEQLSKIISFRGVFELPAVMYLSFTINHVVHHRGQLSVYLRPMGAKVPSIYGESYDAAKARQAAK
jgi:uncharacterized damage-inducible protein DinB